jgi:Ser/Thr protein kinase RdoA (MazF antagonist)
MIEARLATHLAAEHYGLKGEIHPLPSYIDFNFKLQTESGPAYVLKFANPASDPAILEMENAAMRHLAGKTLPFSYPTLLTSLNGEEIIAVANKSKQESCYSMRVITWLAGELYANVSPHTKALHESLGSLLASSALAFSDFEHSAAHRYIKWDMAQLADLEPLLTLYDDQEKYYLLACHLDDFRQKALPAVSDCPRQVIHNDSNNYNVFTATANGRTTCSGLIDFGDMVYSYRIFDLAIAMAYALFGQQDVPAAAQAIVKGYERLLALQPAEKNNLYHLVAARLVQSLLLSAQSYKANPHNEYLLISAQPAWELLEFLHDFGAQRFRNALFQL